MSAQSTTTADVEADKKAAAAVVDLVNDAWGENDGNTFADLYTENATFILSGDRFFQGREHIRRELTASFSGPHRGTRLSTYVVASNVIAPDTVVLVTEGGVMLPGQNTPDRERELRATWVVVKEAGTWLVAAYQNGRRADGALKGDGEH